jgi:hypothetical protein
MGKISEGVQVFYCFLHRGYLYMHAQVRLGISEKKKTQLLIVEKSICGAPKLKSSAVDFPYLSKIHLTFFCFFNSFSLFTVDWNRNILISL